jgi:uncharacterized membrane protein
MLKKITLKYYALTSIFILLVALIVQMSMGKDCAWDGCYSTPHATIAGSLFGLPIIVLQIEVVLGIILLAAKKLERSK